jgi:hypothetical protein
MNVTHACGTTWEFYAADTHDLPAPTSFVDNPQRGETIIGHHDQLAPAIAPLRQPKIVRVEPRFVGPNVLQPLDVCCHN